MPLIIHSLIFKAYVASDPFFQVTLKELKWTSWASHLTPNYTHSRTISKNMYSGFFFRTTNETIRISCHMSFKAIEITKNTVVTRNPKKSSYTLLNKSFSHCSPTLDLSWCIMQKVLNEWKTSLSWHLSSIPNHQPSGRFLICRLEFFLICQDAKREKWSPFPVHTMLP